MMDNKLKDREELLQERLEKIRDIEQEILQKEKAIKDKEKSRKQIVLRLAPSLWQELAAWAEKDFRSINSQIEYLLTECVKKHKL